MRFPLVLSTLCVLSLAACVTQPRRPVTVQLQPRARILVPDAPAAAAVDVSLASNTAQLLNNRGELLAEMDVSLGMPGSETPLGRFRVMEKMPLKRSNLFGQYVKADTREVVVARHWEYKGPKPPGTVYQGIAMPFWMRLTSHGVGMHVGGFERGQPSSKGCVRCPEQGQQFFYEHCPVGTPVHIHAGPHPLPSTLADD